MYAVCPKDASHNRFHTTAHVMEMWEVDERGNFMECTETLQTDHGPDPDNEWTCAECGAQARVLSHEPPKPVDAARAECERLALADFAGACGKVFCVNSVNGYTDKDESTELDGKFIVRIEDTRPHDICHWNNAGKEDWLDPYWNVTVLAWQGMGTFPLRSCWIDGPSRSTQGHKQGLKGKVLGVAVTEKD